MAKITAKFAQLELGFNPSVTRMKVAKYFWVFVGKMYRALLLMFVNVVLFLMTSQKDATVSHCHAVYLIKFA